MNIFSFLRRNKSEKPEAAPKTFESRKQALVEERKKVYDKAVAEHGNDKEWERYVNYCRFYFQEAESATSAEELYKAERMSAPGCYRPRRKG